MPRTQDASIPPEESLYRSVKYEHVDLEDERVDVTAVDLPASSHNRGSIAPPESVLVPKRPLDTGILEIRPSWLPGEVPRTEKLCPYVVFAADDPCPPEDPGNEAHCEVRVKPKDTAVYNPKHKPGKDIAAKLRSEIANRWRIYKPPTPP